MAKIKEFFLKKAEDYQLANPEASFDEAWNYVTTKSLDELMEDKEKLMNIWINDCVNCTEETECCKSCPFKEENKDGN